MLFFGELILQGNPFMTIAVSMLITSDNFIYLLYLCPFFQHQVFQVDKQCLAVLSQVPDDIFRV